MNKFEAFNIKSIPRTLNHDADMLANVASNLFPSDDLSHDKFSVELIYRSSIPHNITNWRVFEDEEQIINFLHSEDTFKGSFIDEEQHEALLQASASEEKSEHSNIILKNIVRLEKLFDLQEKFRRPTNTKTRSSTLLFEAVNLGTEQDPKNINLGKNYTSAERAPFMKLFREYKDIFAWTYEDLKTYDTKIIQHVIPLKENTKPFQQKLGKMYPSLEPLVKKELNKLLAAKIIFPVQHTTWVANLVPVRKKLGDIRICIDFINLNRASLKDNYLVPAMEQILQSVSGSAMLSSLDGFFGYNQVLVSKEDRLKTSF